MKRVSFIIMGMIILGCASTKEIAAPCTYDDRRGCGELIYSHEIIPASSDIAVSKI